MAKKKSVDLFGDEEIIRPKSEFENLLNGTSVATRSLVPGDKIRGEILAITGQEAFISTGTPTDATMPFSPDLELKVGQFIDVIVVRAREGEIFVRPASGRGGTAGVDSLEDAFDMEIPVEGVVTEEVKGGFRVKVQGIAAFCPVSQMDFRVVNGKEYVGKKFEFIISRMERGRDLVVSRRKLLEQERAASEGEFIQKAEVGEIYEGTVFRIEKYGAFVRLSNGIEGLIPISELSWGRIGHPQEVVNLDQSVQVKLLRVEEVENRLKVSFSLKQGGSQVDPWASIESDYPVGTQVEGIVEHKESYGLFVRIASGLTGLLPRSAWRDSVEANQFESKRKGDTLRVRIASVDPSTRKISLAVPGEEEDESWRNEAARAQTKSMGTMADLFKNIKVK